ncbi:methyl-accepting chemotaxis protein [Fontisphaera persica]|uniref:methyl-accepting chemotaxis protein n=1 Tax=Fontisphaera persica TaxID=2974023 RepID=UPI0024C053E8|nr:methyl-accepting chemotaxis protein [Fontisphaera persica]WCJ58239.1 methyl-accepting chemotaxis protein [Fontisphaera persica]
MKLSAKINAGFAGVLVITAIIGVLAVFKMNQVHQTADVIAEDYMPATAVASGVEGNALWTMYQMRGYAYTEETNFLALGLQRLEKTKEAINQARNLAKERGETLAFLSEAAKVAEEKAAEYERLSLQTVEANNMLKMLRQAMDAAAASYMRECYAYLEGQSKILDQLLSQTNQGQNLDLEQFRERVQKIKLINDVIDIGNAIRVGNFKSQATRNPELFQETMKKFNELPAKFAALKALTRQEINIKQLAAVEKAGADYQKEMADFLKTWQKREELNKSRAEVAEVLLSQADMVVTNSIGLSMQKSNVAAASLSTARTFIIIALLIGIVAGVAVAIFIVRNIIPPLKQAIGLTSQVASGDLTQTLSIARSDEIGELAQAVNSMVINLRKNMKSLAETSDTLAASSQELSAAGSQLSSNAEETASQANVVAGASEQVSKSVATVATAAEEISASIKEIARQAVDAAKVANQAATAAERANQTMGRLDASSAEINNVVKVITSIAEQTNLLALNATIEAARAGEAGKGFAVVANEVKELAKQTARATEEIAVKIQTIQGDSHGAVEAIREIGEVIRKIDQIQTVIASAVEEQAATMNEITRNAAEAAQGSQEIARNIAGVSQAAQSTTQAVAGTGAAANELARLAGDLKVMVGQFKLDSGGNGHGMAGGAPVPEALQKRMPKRTPASKTEVKPEANMVAA